MKHIILFFVYLLCMAPICAVTWTGAVSNNWHSSGNWDPTGVPTSTTIIVIPSGLSRYPVITGADAYCQQIQTITGSTLTLNNIYDLHVTAYCNIGGHLVMSGTGDVFVGISMSFNNGSTTSITNNQASLYMYGLLNFGSGSDIDLGLSTIFFLGGNNSILTNMSSNTQITHLYVTKETGHTLEISDDSTQPFTINGALRVYSGSTLYCNYSGAVALKGYLEDMNTSADYGIRWDAGTLFLEGTNQSITLHGPSSYLKNLYCYQTGTVTLYNSLFLKGSLTLERGVLNPNNFPITLAGNWNNYAGTTTSFYYWDSRVIFTGANFQYCTGTTVFNILEVDKVGGAFRIDDSSTTVTCFQYDWTAGAVDVLSGTLNVYSLAEGYIAGNWWLSGGTINLALNDSDYIDLGGHLHIFAGEFNVYGGSLRYPSYWPYNSSASIEMSGGILDFKDQGVYTTDDYPAWSFTENITGGTIRVAQSFVADRSDFTPTGGIIELYGTLDASLSHLSGSNFFNLYINKAAVREAENLPSQHKYRDGTEFPLTRSDKVTVGTNLTVNGYIWVQAGRFDLNHYTVNCLGQVLVNSGVLEIDTNAIFRLADTKTLGVNTGGRLEVIGTSGNPATITSSSAYYYFYVVDGATLAASYAVFEKMQVDGVKLGIGALLDPAYSFTNCTFRNGIAGGTLLTLNNSQNMLIRNAVFPTNTWSGTSNVAKTLDNGIAVFINATGGFAGEAYDNDSWNRINWSLPSIKDLSISIGPSPNTVLISWSYPVTVSRFNIFRSTNPYFTPALFNRVGQVTGSEFIDTADSNKYFYIVKAELD